MGKHDIMLTMDDVTAEELALLIAMGKVKTASSLFRHAVKAAAKGTEAESKARIVELEKELAKLKQNSKRIAVQRERLNEIWLSLIRGVAERLDNANAKREWLRAKHNKQMLRITYPDLTFDEACEQIEQEAIAWLEK